MLRNIREQALLERRFTSFLTGRKGRVEIQKKLWRMGETNAFYGRSARICPLHDSDDTPGIFLFLICFHSITILGVLGAS